MTHVAIANSFFNVLAPCRRVTAWAKMTQITPSQILSLLRGQPGRPVVYVAAARLTVSRCRCGMAPEWPQGSGRAHFHGCGLGDSLRGDVGEGKGPRGSVTADAAQSPGQRCPEMPAWAGLRGMCSPQELRKTRGQRLQTDSALLPDMPSGSGPRDTDFSPLPRFS